MSRYHRLKVRDCQGTLWALYRLYEGRATASFEGDLSGLGLEHVPRACSDESCVLKRQTIAPEMEFYTIPIEETTIKALKGIFSRPGVLGRNGRIVHTQLAVGEELVLIACDNFHDDCTVVSISVPEEYLAEMQKHGILRGYHSDA